MAYTREPTWAKHYRHVWENRAANPHLPLWARLVALAYGTHEANMHTNFRRGDLSLILGEPGKGRRDRSTLRKALAAAVQYGWLAEGSSSECLVVPAGAVVGPPGDPFKPCPVCDRKAAKQTEKPNLQLVYSDATGT
jgi:hypothetical protein